MQHVCRNGPYPRPPAVLQELRQEVELMDGRGMKQEGPRLVVRAWLDPDFKARLLKVTQDPQCLHGDLGTHSNQGGDNTPC